MTSSSRAASSGCGETRSNSAPPPRDALRVEFFGDDIERITRFDPLTGHKLESLEVVTIYPGKQFVTPAEKLRPALLAIREELGERITCLRSIASCWKPSASRCARSMISK